MEARLRSPRGARSHRFSHQDTAPRSGSWQPAIVRVAFLLALTAMCGGVASAQSTFYVDNTHPGASDGNAGTDPELPWLTMGKAGQTAEAGDTVIVAPGGTYDERVFVSNSGTPDARIVIQAGPGTPRPKLIGFTVDNKSYVTISGFEVTHAGMTPESLARPSFSVNSTTSVHITDNYVHDTARFCVRSSPYSGSRSSGLVISGNTFTNIGPNGSRSDCIQISATQSLIANNDISHTEDFIRVFGSYNVIRGNVLHDSYIEETAGGDRHIDGIQSWCDGTPAESMNFTLIENNVMYDVPTDHSHFALINGTSSCGGTTNVIVRGNTATRLGSYFYVSDTNISYGTNHKLYSNTVVDASTASSPKTAHAVINVSGINNASIVNNLFVDAIATSTPAQMFYLSSSSETGSNLAFDTSGNVTWYDPIADEPNGVRNVDPLLAEDGLRFHLQDASPAIDAGGALTRVSAEDSASGIELKVDDASFFQDGWAGVDADRIAVGTPDNVTEIESIDYATNTITLAAPVERGIGDPVWLDGDSAGSDTLVGDSMDIGASESGAPHAESPVNDPEVDAGADEGPLPSITSLDASPSLIAPWEHSDISWTTEDASHVTISGFEGTFEANGSLRVFPAASTTYTVTAVSDANSTTDATVTISIDLDATAETVGFDIPAFGGVSVDAQGGDITAVGHARLVSAASLSGLSMFRLVQGGVTVSEVGVPYSSQRSSGVLPVDVRTEDFYAPGARGKAKKDIIASRSIRTAVALSNHTSEEAVVYYRFTNSDGSEFTSGSTTVPPEIQTAMFFDEAPFDVAAEWSGTFTFSSTVPLGVTGLRTIRNERGEFLMAHLPLVDDSSGQTTALLPYFAGGSGYSTEIVLTNSTGLSSRGAVYFFDSGTSAEAAPLNVNIDGTPGTSVSYDLAPGESTRVTIDSVDTSVIWGSARLVADNGYDVPSAAGYLRNRVNGITMSEAYVPVDAGGFSLRTFVERTGTDGQPGSLQSHFVLTNDSASVNVVTFGLVHRDGTPAGLSTSRTLLPHGQYVGLITDLFPTLPDDFRGLIFIDSTEPLASWISRVRVNERGELLLVTTPTPPAPQTNPLAFYAVGGGYATEFQTFTPTGQPAGVNLLINLAETEDGLPGDIITIDSSGPGNGNGNGNANGRNN